MILTDKKMIEWLRKCADSSPEAPVDFQEMEPIDKQCLRYLLDRGHVAFLKDAETPKGKAVYLVMPEGIEFLDELRAKESKSPGE